MTYTSTVSTKGQITIPETLRQGLGIKPGDKALFLKPNSKTKEVTLRLIKHLSLEELGGSLHIKGMKYVPISKARAILAKSQKSETWI